MNSGLRVIGLAAVAVVAQLATSGRADAALNYTGQTPQNVSVMYFDLPANTQIIFVNEISGGSGLASAVVSGSGTLVLPLTGLPPGQYFLQARQGSVWIAQTVLFYF